MKIEVDLGNNEGREEYAIIEVVDDALEFKLLGQTFHPDTGAYDYPLTAGSVVRLGFPILAVFRLKRQPKRDDGMIFGSCKASQSPVYPIRDAILAVNHASCPSLSSSGPPPMG